MSVVRRAAGWPQRQLARRVTPLLRRVALQARSGSADPAGVGPLLVVGPLEWSLASHDPTYASTIRTVLEGTRFRLVDTSHKRNQVIDLGRLARQAFGPDADPIVFFLMGPWLGNAGNRLVNHAGLRKLYDIQDQMVDKQVNVILRPHGFRGALHRFEGAETDRLRALTEPLGVRHYYWPYYVDPRQHRDWGLPKVYDVCLYGTLNAGTYPLRVRVHRLLTERPGPLRVRIVRRDEGISGRRLSRIINQSWLTFADTTVVDRFLSRFVEIPLSGSCIVGSVPSRHRDFFSGRVVEIEDDMSDDQILSVIHAALGDPDRLARMTRALRADVLRRYTTTQGRADFWAILRDFAGSAIERQRRGPAAP